jgi:mannose-1-phosphate guanylyltransferase
MHREHTWALLLAAGDGTRLRPLTTTPSGMLIPKQFCSLQGGPSLLHDALCRARALTSSLRVCAIVAEQHRRWWEPQLWSLPAGNKIVQPKNCGTANGILLSLLHILEWDPLARIVILPTDHHVSDEAVLARAMRQGIEQLPWRPNVTVLLGLEPDDADPQLGYIVPGAADDGLDLHAVERFVEKPSALEACELIKCGALWNAFIVMATAQAMLELFRRRMPDVVASMRAAIQDDLSSFGRERSLASLYDRLPVIDFSRDIAQGQERFLGVLPVARCGWSDLGTPERVAHALQRTPAREAAGGWRAADECLNEPRGPAAASPACCKARSGGNRLRSSHPRCSCDQRPRSSGTALAHRGYDP